MAERVLICGSGDYPSMSDVEEYVAKLPADTIVIGCDARGVSHLAARVAERRGLTVERNPPDWTTGTHAYYERSCEMVSRADRVVVFRSGGSPRTMHTIREAVRSGKKTIVFSPNWAPYPDGAPGEEYPGALPPAPKTTPAGHS
jgi:hypothetical protein